MVKKSSRVYRSQSSRSNGRAQVTAQPALRSAPKIPSARLPHIVALLGFLGAAPTTGRVSMDVRLRGEPAHQRAFAICMSDYPSCIFPAMKKLLAVVIILAGGAIGQAAKPTPQTKTTPKAEAAPQSHVGRYQLFFSPHARADVYMVDTETGQIWKPITINNARDTNLNSAPEVWVYQDRIDTEKDFDLWMLSHAPPAPAPSRPQR